MAQARIFLSSGQAEGTTEAELVKKVQLNLEELGYQVTAAAGSTAPRGVWEDILRRLRQSEYLVLVDFKRRVASSGSGPDDWDRSLISHQELAIAVASGIPFRVFTEAGLIPRVGILRLVPSSPKMFTRQRLVAVVRREVRRPGWSAIWRRELRMGRKVEGSNDVDWIRYGPPPYRRARYFLIDVENQSDSTLASEVHAFLKGWSGGPLMLPFHASPLLELKWDAVTPRAVSIPPHATRRFSGVLMFKDEPRTAQVGVNTLLMDSNAFRQECQLAPSGAYRLRFVVYSREFAPSEQDFILKLGVGPEDSSLIAAS